jgi:exopolysaccharide biosynthesis operon protein EpsL
MTAMNVYRPRYFKWPWPAISRHRLLSAALGTLVAGLLVRPVGAQYEPPRDTTRDETGFPLEDARRISLGVTVSYDSNFFRDPAILRDAQSDTIVTGFVGFHIDKPYGQQRLRLDAIATAYRYHNFSYLNFEGLDYRAAWDWRLTSRLSGTLSANRTQTPTQFQDTFSRQSDVTTNKNYAFNVDGWLFGGWHILLGIAYSNLSSQQESLQGSPDFRETRGDAGIRYLFQSGSSIDALWRRVDGEQDSQVINNVIVVSSENYKEDQYELRANWIVSAASTVTGRVTNFDRRYDVTPQNDFSGTGGELGWSWSPTSKLSMRLAATRNIVPWQSLTSNHRVSNVFSFAPTWQATAITRVYLSYQRTYDDYPATSATTPERKDTTGIAVLGLNWLALRSLTIGASVQYQNRTSNNPLVEYDTTIARISASLSF